MKDFALILVFGYVCGKLLFFVILPAEESPAKAEKPFAFAKPVEASKPAETKPCDCKGVTPCPCADCQCKPKKEPSQAVPQNRMLMFTATWCGPCQIWKRDEVPALIKQGWTLSSSGTSHIQYIDYDQRQDLVQKYRVTSWPTLIMIKPDGTEIDRAGYLDAHDTGEFFYSNQPDPRSSFPEAKGIIEPPQVQYEQPTQQRWTFFSGCANGRCR